MLEGLMQDDFPLTLHHLLRRMRSCHPDAEVVTLTPSGSTERVSFGETAERVDRLARALGSLGVKPGDRVGTFAWNNQRHFELYMAIPCVGAVLHTLNIRLFAEQLTYIVNHAEDRYCFFDLTFAPLVERLAPECKSVKGWVAMTDRAQMPTVRVPNLLCYEDLLAADLAQRFAEHRKLRRGLSGGHRRSPHECPGRSRSPRPRVGPASSRPSSSPRSSGCAPPR